MTTKIKGTAGVEFPDATTQASAAYTKAESDAAFLHRTSETKTATGASVSWAVPAWAKRITVLFNQVSSGAGSNGIQVGLGTGGAVQNTNLVGQRVLIGATNSFVVPASMATTGLTTATTSKALGSVVLEKLPNGLSWQGNSQVSRLGDNTQDQCCTFNSFAAAVDFLAMTLTSGTFNGGSFTAIFEG